MQFTAIFATALLAAGAMADLHFRAWCADREYKGINEAQPSNPDATQAACDRYKLRNTGTKQWDTCPDCITSFRGDLKVCNSGGKHIGGDEWNYYCKAVGADLGKAS